MAMTRKDRFRLKSQLVDVLNTDEWDFQKVNLLFGEFELDPLDDNWHGPSIVDTIAAIPDFVLIEMYSLVMDIDTNEVEDAVEASADVSTWKPGYIKLFISHSARHKKFVGEVANELAVVGIHGFVAHDSMTVSKPWQRQIEQSLRSMDVFVALLHPESKTSPWCHQEVGWALGRRVPHFAIRMGDDPAGFIAIDQWESGFELDAKAIANLIYRHVAGIPEFGSSIIDGLFTSLAEVGDYMSAGSAAARIAELGVLSEDDFKRLDGIWWSNDQLYGGALPTREMAPFYKSNGRDWPPPKPAPTPTDATNPWGSPAIGEPPF